MFGHYANVLFFPSLSFVCFIKVLFTKLSIVSETVVFHRTDFDTVSNLEQIAREDAGL